MKYKTLNFVTMDEVEYLAVQRDNQVFVINKKGRYMVGILNICGNRYKVDGEDHLFVSVKDAIECLLERVLV